jgi:tripartite-type tricarboxylate transporter receptor subunit TctC
VGRKETRQVRGQVAADRVVVREQRDVTFDAAREGQQVRMHLLQLREASAHVLAHHGAGARDLHTPRPADEQRRADRILQALEPHARRRRREVAAGRAAREVQLLRHGQEHFQVREVVVHRAFVFAKTSVCQIPLLARPAPADTARMKADVSKRRSDNEKETTMPYASRRRFLLSLAGGAALLQAAPAARAQAAYPVKPLTLVVPFAPGGTTDILARIVADGLGKRLGQAVIVDNRGGAGGNIGAAAVASAAADGYTLLMGYNGTNAINPSLYRKLSWDPVRSFDPVSLVARVNNVVVVTPQLPVNTLPELVAYAKANPGKLNYGSAGAGSIFHLAGEMLSHQTGVAMTHIPYKGAAPALTDLMAGQVQVMFSTIPTALPFIKSGKLRAIAVTGAQRSPLFPNLPSAAEAGFRDMVVDSWFAVFAPHGVPAPIQARLSQSLRELLADPAVARKFEEQGADVRTSTPAELAALLAQDLKHWRTVVASAKVTLD